MKIEAIKIKNNSHSRWVKQQAFTMIELMVAMAIVGIMSAIAIPSYQQYVMKSRRVAAITTLLDMASREERFYTSQNTYSILPSDIGYGTGTSVPSPSAANNYYTVSVATASVTCGITSCYTLQAVPVAGSTQAKDAECGTFTYTSTGIKSQTGTGSLKSCWKS